MNELQPTSQPRGLVVSMRNWAGKKLAPFTGRTVFSVRKHNELLSAVVALLNPSISRGSADKIDISDSNWHLQISGAGGGGSGGGGITRITSIDGSVTITPVSGTGPTEDLSVANSGITREVQFSAFGFNGDYNYITCGTEKVRLPPLLRFSVVSRTVYGITISYLGYDPVHQSRVAKSGGFNITQYITPQYVPGDTLYVTNVAGTLQDLNVDARTFAGP